MSYIITNTISLEFLKKRNRDSQDLEQIMTEIKPYPRLKP